MKSMSSRRRVEHISRSALSPKRLMLLLLLLALMLGMAGLAWALQPQESLASWPVAALDGDQVEADIAYNPDDGNYLLVFVSHQGDDWSIYGQILNGEGYVTLPVTPLATGGGEERHHPAVAYNQQAGEFLVVWEETFLGQDWDIRGIRVTPVGVPVGDSFAVAARNNPERQPDVAWDSVGNRYLVVWKQTVDTMTDVSGQLLNELGQAIGSDFPITFSSAEESLPQVAFEPGSRRYMVVWQEPGAGADVNVRGQLLDKDGNWVGGVIDITANGWLQKNPAIAAGGGQFLTAWSEQPNSDHRDVVGQRFNVSGAAVGSKLIISTGENDFRNNPALAYNPVKGAWLAVWEYEAGDDDDDILGRYVQSNGAMLGDELVIAGNSRMQAQPAVAAGNNDSYLIVWQEKVNDSFDIYAGVLGTPSTPTPTPVPTVTPPPPPMPYKVWLPLVQK